MSHLGFVEKVHICDPPSDACKHDKMLNIISIYIVSLNLSYFREYRLNLLIGNSCEKLHSGSLKIDNLTKENKFILLLISNYPIIMLSRYVVDTYL